MLGSTVSWIDTNPGYDTCAARVSGTLAQFVVVDGKVYGVVLAKSGYYVLILSGDLKSEAAVV